MTSHMSLYTENTIHRTRFLEQNGISISYAGYPRVVVEVLLEQQRRRPRADATTEEKTTVSVHRTSFTYHGAIAITQWIMYLPPEWLILDAERT